MLFRCKGLYDGHDQEASVRGSVKIYLALKLKREGSTINSRYLDFDYLE